MSVRESLLARRQKGLELLGGFVLARDEADRNIAIVRADIDAIDKVLTALPVESPPTADPAAKPIKGAK